MKTMTSVQVDPKTQISVLVLDQLKSSTNPADEATVRFFIDQWMKRDWRTLLILIKEGFYDEFRRVLGTISCPSSSDLLEIFRTIAEINAPKLAEDVFIKFHLNSLLLREVTALFIPLGHVALVGEMMLHTKNRQLLEESIIGLVKTKCDGDLLITHFDLQEAVRVQRLSSELIHRCILLYLELGAPSEAIKLMDVFSFDVQEIFILARGYGYEELIVWIMANFAFKNHAELVAALVSFSSDGKIDAVMALLANHKFQTEELQTCVANLKAKGADKTVQKIIAEYELPPIETKPTGWLSGWLY